MSLPEVPKSLIEKLKKDKIVIFAGAGLSVNAGFPNWKNLVISILNELRDKEGKAQGYIDALNGDILEPIEVLKKIQHLRTFAIEIFEKEIRSCDSLQPTEIHRKIGNLTHRIVTTNYDDLLEKSNHDFEKIPYYNSYKVSKISEYNKTVFKIHGDINEPDKCVLFPNEYEDLYSHNEKSAVFELKKIFSDKSILFVGFSLSDPYINFIIDYVSKIYSGFTPEHYILTADKFKKWPDRITPIVLEKYDYLSSFLDLLIENKQADDDAKHFPTILLNDDDKIDIKFLSELEYDIPPNIKYWVGRKKEVENISNENFKVIFITGIGGQGKSALAAHFLKIISIKFCMNLGIGGILKKRITDCRQKSYQ